MHACRQSFVKAHRRLGPRPREARHHPQHQLLHERAGHAGRAAHLRGRHLGPGKYVEMRAEMDVLALICNCPQLNNPCNAYNPTPMRVLIWDPADLMFTQRPDRQSRRHRLPRSSARCGGSACRRSRSTPTPIGTRRTWRRPTQPFGIGPPAAAESYLNRTAILDAARATGAEAIHPGYGFLSENAGFRRGLRARRHRVPRADAGADARARPEAHGARDCRARGRAAAAGHRPADRRSARARRSRSAAAIR